MRQSRSALLSCFQSDANAALTKDVGNRAQSIKHRSSSWIIRFVRQKTTVQRDEMNPSLLRKVCHSKCTIKIFAPLQIASNATRLCD